MLKEASKLTRTALQMSFTFSVAAYVVIKSLLLWSVINYEESARHWGHCGRAFQFCIVIPGTGWLFWIALCFREPTSYPCFHRNSMKFINPWIWCWSKLISPILNANLFFFSLQVREFEMAYVDLFRHLAAPRTDGAWSLPCHFPQKLHADWLGSKVYRDEHR